MKIVFAGTPDFAAVHLNALIASNHEILAVYTQPDRPAGRGKKLKPSPVKTLALESQLPVLQPLSLKIIEEQQKLAEFNADLMIVVAYGLLLPQAVLDIPRLGCINVHASILPRWRGAAPIQRTIEAQDSETGVTIMQMDQGLDTGDMLLKQYCEILPSDTAGTLHDRLAQIGPPALLECLDKIQNGTIEPEQQDNNQSTYAKKILKEEGIIDWQLSAEELCARIRAFNPFPVCYASLDEERLRIQNATPDLTAHGTPGEILQANKNGILVATGKGAINITQLQLPGKKPMASAEILNGFSHLFSPGKCLK